MSAPTSASAELSQAPAFSVVMCTFNAAQYLLPSVQSVLDQSFQDFELIVVDDGSTDNTVALLKSLQDARIKLSFLPENKGLLQARMHGFGLATGKYIALMDSDDICEPDRLEKQFEVMEAGLVDVCGAFHRTLYSASGQRVTKKSHTTSNDLRALLLLYSPLCNPVVSFKRALLDQASYRPEYEHAEDYGFWCELSSNGARFQNIAKPLLTYLVHPGQVSQTKREAARRSFDRAQQTYQRWLGLSDFPPSVPLSLVQRVQTMHHVLCAVYSKIGSVSPSVSMALYRSCQMKRSVWHSLLLRIERSLFVVAWYAALQYARR